MKHPTWQYLINWCSRMSDKYGNIVWEGDKKWDWGQALCREAFGPEWANSPEFKEIDESPPKNPVPDSVLSICRQWEGGEWPEWTEQQPEQLAMELGGGG